MSTTDGHEHTFYEGSETYVTAAILSVTDTGFRPSKVTRFALANVIKWEVADRE